MCNALWCSVLRRNKNCSRPFINYAYLSRISESAPLRGCPLLGPEVLEVDSYACSTWGAAGGNGIALRLVFRILPVALRGNAGSITTRRGTL